MKKIIDSVTNYPLIFLIATLFFALPFIAFSPFVKTIENVDYFRLEHNSDVEFYDKFKDIFGNDEFFVIAFEKREIFTKKNLSLIKNITEELENIEEVREVTSLSNVDDIIGNPDYFEVKKFLADIPDDTKELERLKKQAINNPLYVKNLISSDAQTAAIIIQAYDRPDDENYRKRLIDKTSKVLDHYRKEVDKFHLAGSSIINLNLSRAMKMDVAKFVPVTYLLIILAIWLFFRNLRLTLLAIVNISVCMGSTMGLLGMTGITMNNVTSIILPLIMALALCDTVHIFTHMDKKVLEEFPDKHKALASVLKKVVLPCFLTTLTTAIGFLSLAVSEIPPIKEFAYMASAGIFFEFIYSFFFLPPLILFFAPEKIYREYNIQRGMTRLLSRINDLVQEHSKLIVIAMCVIVLTGCWFASKLRVETNLIEFFKKNGSMRTSLVFVEKRLGGVDSLDISLKAGQDAFKEPSNLEVIEGIQKHIKSLRGVDVTLSFVDFIKDMNESFHNEDPQYYKLPETREMVSQYLLLYGSDDIEDFINDEYDHARIGIRISEHGSVLQGRLIDEIKDYIECIAHPGLDIRVTGNTVQQVNTIDALVKGQIYSLGLAAGVIGIIMFLVLRSIALGCLSLIPNLFPIVLNFGVMGAAGIPLDTGTSLIAAVALGIAVDDTIHFLFEYKKKRVQKMPISESLKAVILIKGRAIISSSLILCIGFGVLTLSSFVPTIHFGLLNAIIMITALIGDLVVLPSVLLLKKRPSLKTGGNL